MSDSSTSLGELSLDPAHMPRHVAIIMDGNGRWAQKRGWERMRGHQKGVDAVRRTVQGCLDCGVSYLTLYAFSTENWKRPHTEVDFLMGLFSEFLAKEIDEMDADDVCLQFIGRISELSPKLREQAEKAQERTRENQGVRFNVAMNYGGQDELTRAVQKIAQKAVAGELSPDAIDEHTIEAELDTAGLPPVDFVIRTSGDLRLSNFLLWQAAYAEFWFTQTNWPDFTPACFVEALLDFGQRKRRFGGLKNK